MFFLIFISCKTTLSLPESAGIFLEDSNNFSFSSQVQAESIPIVPMEDAVVHWNDLSVDMLGNDMNSTDITMVSVVLFPRLSQQEVLFGVSNETLRQSDLSGYVEYYPSANETSAILTDFSMQGIYIDPVEHFQTDSGTFLLTFSSDELFTRTFLFFDPDDETDNQDIFVSNESTVVDYEIDLVDLDKIVITPAQRWMIDWSGLTQSGSDRPLNLPQLDQIQIVVLEDDISTIEEHFLHIESRAKDIYSADVLGVDQIALSELKNKDDDIFDPTILSSSENNVLLALRCMTCVNPAPLFVGILEEGD
jgi:hypothetical protein